MLLRQGGLILMILVVVVLFAIQSPAQATPPALPALNLSIYDTEDPIAVGKQTIYVVEARNEGTAPMQDLRVTLSSSGVKFVKALGTPAPTLVDKSLVVSAATPIAPGGIFMFRLLYEATTKGSAIFHSETQFKGLSKPIVVEESTSVY